uniref:CSON010673 protein n=1 Tax=Culicoides sonorensis TaxID=179676 RepID=A0A336K054_CULSO
MKLLYKELSLILIVGAILVAADSNEKNTDDGDKNDDKLSTDNALIKAKRQASAIPTIENCKKLREECLRSCPKISNCTEQCPVCPIITKVDPVPASPAVVNRNYVIENGNEESKKFSVNHLPGANYTTIIRLSNVINNTNIVKVPTNLNNTNINTIKIFANSSQEKDESGLFGVGTNENGESCCYVIHPKTCRHSMKGYRCHHRRHKTCGPQCSSRQIHVQARSRCSPQEGCQRRIAYVPEPRPSCRYTNYWPYINCMGVRAIGHYSCAGCYDHYGHGYSSYYSQSSYNECNGCYDDAFDYGPLYRRGPVLRRFYYHEPPCYITGRCSYSGYYQGDYGNFGNEFVDPAFGPIYDDETPDSDGNDTISDWGVILSKCKVVTANETVNLENCTISRENPFAAAPEMIQNYVPMNLDYEDPPPNYFRQNGVTNKRTRISNKQPRRLKRKIRKHTKISQ